MDTWTRSQIISTLLSKDTANLPKKDILSTWKRNAKKYHRMPESELIKLFIDNILIPQNINGFIYENRIKQLEVINLNGLSKKIF
jgi:hypothetical protein